VPPEACRMGAAVIAASFPETHRRLRALLDGWIASGFAANARLGWPLEIVMGEYVSVNRWRWAWNASCVLGAVFNATRMYSQPCTDRCPTVRTQRRLHVQPADTSLDECWIRCTVEALLYIVPAELTRRTVLEAAGKHAPCPHRPYALLDGPVEYAMGSTEMLHVRGRGRTRFRLLSNLMAWLTELTNVTVYTGYHDWHVDGPAADGYGREHKAYILVSKGGGDDASGGSGEGGGVGDGSGGEGGSSGEGGSGGGNSRGHSNLRLVSNAARQWAGSSPSAAEAEAALRLQRMSVAGRCQERSGCVAAGEAAVTVVGGAAGKADGEASEAAGDGVDGCAHCLHHLSAIWPTGWSGEAPSAMRDALMAERVARMRAWGVLPAWPAIDALGCDVPLSPGDMLFWRDDVWHRTQDIMLDRVALRLDVLRFPLPGDQQGQGM